MLRTTYRIASKLVIPDTGNVITLLEEKKKIYIYMYIYDILRTLPLSRCCQPEGTLKGSCLLMLKCLCPDRTQTFVNQGLKLIATAGRKAKPNSHFLSAQNKYQFFRRPIWSLNPSMNQTKYSYLDKSEIRPSRIVSQQISILGRPCSGNGNEGTRHPI